MSDNEERHEKKAAQLRSERQAKSGGVPRADTRYRESNGRVCDQMRGLVDETDRCKPPLETGKARNCKGERTVYPTSEQADQLTALLRARCRLVYCFGNDERVFEGMLERRGLEVMAIDSDVFQNADAYYEKRIYCNEVRRVSTDSLLTVTFPAETALVFVRSMLTPWRAYLARYPQVPLVICIGADEDERMYEPRPFELDAISSLRLLRRMEIACATGAPLTMAVYENVAAAA